MKQLFNAARYVRWGMAALWALAVSLPCLAADSDAYSENPNAQRDLSNWMANLHDSKLLFSASIPGTHDTMAYVGGDAVRTQTMNLEQQLKAGVRFFDFRLGFKTTDATDLHFYHGSFDLGTYLGRDALPTIKKFLDSHPSETVLIRIKREHDGEDADRFSRVLQTVLGGYSSYLYIGANAEFTRPIMQNVRGKIVIFRDFPASHSYPIHYGMLYGSNASIQDDFKLTTNWDLYNKWDKVKNQFKIVTRWGYSGEVFMNFLSGAFGSFPYFVASGYGPTGQSLSTARTNAEGNVYPDFKLGDCLGSWCTFYFVGTDILTLQALQGVGRAGANNRDFASMKDFGIVIMDFPGPVLIEEIAKRNTNP